jgi:diguanylate cyclase (GGDEF)-like protein
MRLIPLVLLAAIGGTSIDGGDGRAWLVPAGIGTVVALVIAGTFVARRRERRRAAAAPVTLDELADVGRRLARVTAAGQIHRALVREAIGLVPARSGAVVVRDGAALRLAFAGEPDRFVVDRLADGAVGRAVETGRPVALASASEPSLAGPRAALVAVPLGTDGRVSAVLVLLRGADEPFTGAERSLLGAFAPVAASAMLTARRAAALLEPTLVDPLTRVGNRRKLDHDLAAALQDHDSHPVALLMVELDHCTGAGDLVLSTAAETMLRTVRPTDAVYRFGGEEFALVLPAAPLPEAAAVAERVRAAIEARELWLPDSARVRLTASIGLAVAALGQGDDAAAALVADADAALYRAKEAGRNRVEWAEPTAGTVPA